MLLWVDDITTVLITKVSRGRPRRHRTMRPFAETEATHNYPNGRSVSLAKSKVMHTLTIVGTSRTFGRKTHKTHSLLKCGQCGWTAELTHITLQGYPVVEERRNTESHCCAVQRLIMHNCRSIIKGVIHPYQQRKHKCAARVGDTINNLIVAYCSIVLVSARAVFHVKLTCHYGRREPQHICNLTSYLFILWLNYYSVRQHRTIYWFSALLFPTVQRGEINLNNCEHFTVIQVNSENCSSWTIIWYSCFHIGFTEYVPTLHIEFRLEVSLSN